jgi:FkbM family methyltransferase
MDLSYAQHLEDYHLSRVFGDQASGFYVDVGAGHPVADNVSCWFYLRGWRGIVVEPQADLAALYAHVRPRDAVERCALGRARGEVAFHAVERLHGFSTTVEQFAARASDFGAGYHTERVPMETLAALCEKHGVDRIDFLKIDVEGAEGEVLAGGDWSRFRPRVVVCEAVAPGSMADNWSEWEPILLAAGYQFVLHDGLNRWYVAREDAELLARFPRQKAEWLVVPHLGHTNRAPFRDDHPDHTFAKELVGAFFARLPLLDRHALLRLVLHAEKGDVDRPCTREEAARIIARLFPAAPFLDASRGLENLEAPTVRACYEKIVDSDQFRIMLGRLAMSWDGGQILD